MNKMLDDVINRRESEGAPVKKDLVQIILDAHQMDPVAFPELRMRDEIMMFMCVFSLLVEVRVSWIVRVARSHTMSASTTAILLLRVSIRRSLTAWLRKSTQHSPVWIAMSRWRGFRSCRI
jgi:hypothetical protein